MSASYPTKLLLAFRSGNLCAFPSCGKSLTADGDNADPAVIGEAAHIAGEHMKAARFVSSMTDQQRDHYDNLIYLCGSCHTRIDKQEKDFSITRLTKMKLDHERAVRAAMNTTFADVAFPELHRATEWARNIAPSQVSSDYSLIPLQDKIKKNSLSDATRATIAMGISVAKEVRAFLESETQIDADFPEKLTAGFLEHYYRLRKDGMRGDDLFDMMCSFAQQGFNSQAQKSAGLAVLIYLFETCEVFEK